jgi:putative NIF3 family GTP cyclohydrolase 1 type 2
MSLNISDHQSETSQSRRGFITNGLKVAGAATLLSIPVGTMAADMVSCPNEYTVQDIIDIILKAIPVALSPNTVDTIKIGSANQKVTGIVTTMFPTIEVIKEAIKIKANFIIPHEPTFYNHADRHDLIENNDVLQRKMKLLNENNIAIWRAHDSWHALKPDGITYGVVKKAGWEDFYQSPNKIMTIPAASLKKIAQHLKTKLEIAHLRVIGNLSNPCKRIALLPGAWGGQNHIKTFVEEKPDLLIIGEANEWETPEYIRDAQSLGINVSLIVLGHAVSEEPGMEWMSAWLQPKVPGIKVTHIASKDPFNWI